jgi:hypothetical protein
LSHAAKSSMVSLFCRGWQKLKISDRIVTALNFLVLFASRQKEQKLKMKDDYFNCIFVFKSNAPAKHKYNTAHPWPKTIRNIQPPW